MQYEDLITLGISLGLGMLGSRSKPFAVGLLTIWLWPKNWQF